MRDFRVAVSFVWILPDIFVGRIFRVARIRRVAMRRWILFPIGTVFDASAVWPFVGVQSYRCAGASHSRLPGKCMSRESYCRLRCESWPSGEPRKEAKNALYECAPCNAGNACAYSFLRIASRGDEAHDC